MQYLGDFSIHYFEGFFSLTILGDFSIHYFEGFFSLTILGDFSIHYFEGNLKWFLPLELLRITFPNID